MGLDTLPCFVSVEESCRVASNCPDLLEDWWLWLLVENVTFVLAGKADDIHRKWFPWIAHFWTKFAQQTPLCSCARTPVVANKSEVLLCGLGRNSVRSFWSVAVTVFAEQLESRSPWTLQRTDNYEILGGWKLVPLCRLCSCLSTDTLFYFSLAACSEHRLYTPQLCDDR